MPSRCLRATRAKVKMLMSGVMDILHSPGWTGRANNGQFGYSAMIRTAARDTLQYARRKQFSVAGHVSWI